MGIVFFTFAIELEVDGPYYLPIYLMASLALLHTQ
jgi:hypothetical protein